MLNNRDTAQRGEGSDVESVIYNECRRSSFAEDLFTSFDVIQRNFTMKSTRSNSVSSIKSNNSIFERECEEEQEFAIQWIPHSEINTFLPDKPNRPLYITNIESSQFNIPIKLSIDPVEKEENLIRVDSKIYTPPEQNKLYRSGSSSTIRITNLTRQRSVFDILTRKKKEIGLYDPIMMAAKNFHSKPEFSFKTEVSGFASSIKTFISRRHSSVKRIDLGKVNEGIVVDVFDRDCKYMDTVRSMPEKRKVLEISKMFK
jgi:hypothetical protein